MCDLVVRLLCTGPLPPVSQHSNYPVWDKAEGKPGSPGLQPNPSPAAQVHNVPEELSSERRREESPFLQGLAEKGQNFWWKKYGFDYFSISALDPLLLTELGLTPSQNLARGLDVNAVDPGIEARLRYPWPLSSISLSSRSPSHRSSHLPLLFLLWRQKVS